MEVAELSFSSGTNDFTHFFREVAMESPEVPVLPDVATSGAPLLAEM